jgi:hypothetical protein
LILADLLPDTLDEADKANGFQCRADIPQTCHAAIVVQSPIGRYGERR